MPRLWGGEGEALKAGCLAAVGTVYLLDPTPPSCTCGQKEDDGRLGGGRRQQWRRTLCRPSCLGEGREHASGKRGQTILRLEGRLGGEEGRHSQDGPCTHLPDSLTGNLFPEKSWL